MEDRAAAFYTELRRRRSVREYDDAPVPHGVIEHALLAALSASTANQLSP